MTGASRLARLAGAAAALGVGCVAYGTLIERRWYRLRRVAVPGVLRRRGAGLKILHLSDIHLVPGQDHRIRFLASLAGLNHDLVVVTGDLLGAAGAESLSADTLAPLIAGGRPGLVVLGSNDRYGPVPKSPVAYFTRPRRRVHGVRLDTDGLVAALADRGYRTFMGGADTVATAVGPVAVGAMDDPHLRTTVLPEVEELRPPIDDAVLHLGLVHAPYTRALDRLVEAGHELLLSGHTHGGQVRLPGVGALVANCDLPLDQARGLSRYRSAWLHVSPGLGHSRYAPFRFACRPEATLLELTG